ncbi:MAG TPA: hypothetical protein P5119_12250 [Candidatus Aminicenantes bacterium]|nr:hypothetical protein [Candidatus Aminicenantes bacterium]HRY66095.1 hypothetical protein [Candidatus Aminicenantes bacterium]HRZ73009.1 hypothetical protein [Candidatus Aminicenantes bacterium]
MMRRGADGRGTGLIEAVAALAVGLVIAVGAAEMMTLALRAGRRGDLAAAVTRAIVDRLEILKSRPFGDPALAAGAYAETVRIEPGAIPIAESWEIADEEDGQKRIRLRARPAGSAGPETAALLFISRDLGFDP